jgi:glyoxylate reductase
MPKQKVFVTRKIAKEALELLAKNTEMELWEGELPPPRDVLLSKVESIDGLLSLLTDRIDKELMDAAPKLKAVSNMAVGYDNVDVPEATRRGIFIGYTPEVLTETTADFTFTLMLAAARRLTEADRYVKAGNWKTWEPMLLLGQDIHHATLGIIGCGRIGLEVAKRAKGFDMKIIYHDKVRRSPLEERTYGLEYIATLKDLLKRADFVTIHTSLTPETRHLIGKTELAMMKPNAFLINASRGAIVDQDALYQALKSKQILGAALDVTEVEPIPMSDPLLTLDNVIIAPHIASASVKTRTKMALMAVENLLAGLKGELPPNCVNPEIIKMRR